MSECVILDTTGMAKEEVSASEFAELKSDVRHMKDDVHNMKDSHKETSKAIQSISVSLATLTAHVEQNNKLEPRIGKLEKKVESNASKIAAATGAATAIGLFIGYVTKLKGLFD